MDRIINSVQHLIYQTLLLKLELKATFLEEHDKKRSHKYETKLKLTVSCNGNFPVINSIIVKAYLILTWTT